MAYDHKKIEKKWQRYWDEHKTFKTTEDPNKKKYYAMDMFPYPSGQGLHVGHPEGYTATDILSRMKRMQGYNVLHPMGWDAFGLPAEQYALKTGHSPREFTQKNINNFRRQIKSLGLSYDWDREVNTSDPSYYKWTQWIFEQLYKKGLAYEAEVPVNWSPDLGTVVANEEIVDGNGDNDWEVVSVDRNVLVIDRDFIGDEQTYVCKAAYRETGDLPTSPDTYDQSATTRIVRYIPRIECDYKGVITGCPAGTSYIYPQGYVRDSKGVISNPEEWFRFVWMGKKPGATSYTQVGEGMNPTIAFVEGMLLDLQIEDKGPQALIVDNDDSNIYITDENGVPSYQRMYEKTY